MMENLWWRTAVRELLPRPARRLIRLVSAVALALLLQTEAGMAAFQASVNAIANRAEARANSTLEEIIDAVVPDDLVPLEDTTTTTPS